jgi:hypothetical protein
MALHLSIHSTLPLVRVWPLISQHGELIFFVRTIFKAKVKEEDGEKTRLFFVPGNAT